MVNFDIPSDWIPAFFLTFARIGGLVTFAPFIGSGAISRWIRILFAVSLTLLLFPTIQEYRTEVPLEFLSFTVALIREIGVGLVLGLIGKLVFASLEVAGQMMGFQMGFGFIRVIDPQTQVESPFMSIFLNLVGMMTFLSFNGHHWYLRAMVESFRLAPDGAAFSGPLVYQLIQSVSDMFLLGLKISAPIVVVLFVIDVLLGIIGRAAPQIHLLIVGLPAKGIVGFIFLTATIYSFIPFLARILGRIEVELATYIGLIGR